MWLQVVHHPTVIAAHAWGTGWEFAGDVDLRNKFWGRSIELQPVGVLVLTFKDGDQYVWRKVLFPYCLAGGTEAAHCRMICMHSLSGCVCP